ncbi:MAG: hypothetical protein K0U59_01180 [Gammaproteobacteria bacterium]|nr:hypothetical protein [Gammaproteobacteria bacterium]
MKKIIFIVSLFTSLNVLAASGSEIIPNDRTITNITVYADLVVIAFTPSFQNNQGCTSSSSNKLQLNLAEDSNKALFSTLLTAAASKSKVGFGINGCAGQFPKLYRVEPSY